MKVPAITFQSKLFNSKAKKLFRKDLRKSATMPEKILWNNLRNRQYLNLKFRQQYSIGKYIVDFYCPEVKLAIEIDGANHFFDERSAQYDNQRTKYIESKDIKVVRFLNSDVTDNINGVMEIIGSFKTSL